MLTLLIAHYTMLQNITSRYHLFLSLCVLQTKLNRVATADKQIMSETDSIQARVCRVVFSV